MAGRSCPRQSPGPPCVPNGFGHAVVLIKAGVGGEQGEQRNGEDQQQGRSALARCGGRGSGWRDEACACGGCSADDVIAGFFTEGAKEAKVE